MFFVENYQALIILISITPLATARFRASRAPNPMARVPVWTINFAVVGLTFNTLTQAVLQSAQGNYWWCAVAVSVLFIWYLLYANLRLSRPPLPDHEAERVLELDRRASLRRRLSQMFTVTIIVTVALLLIAMFVPGQAGVQ